MMVTDKDLPDLEEIERICPIHELHLSPLKKETADSRVLSESKERLLEEMRDFRDHFKLKRPEFHPDPGYDITDLPLDYDYPEETFSSWDDADEALRKCFKNHVYDEDIRSMMTRQILAATRQSASAPTTSRQTTRGAISTSTTKKRRTSSAPSMPDGMPSHPMKATRPNHGRKSSYLPRRTRPASAISRPPHGAWMI